MPAVSFFTNGLCPYAQRVALALEWKAIPHERVEIDLSNKPAWYASRLGTSLVPAIELDGEPHAESLDIVRLLDREFAPPEFAPLAPPERAAAVQSLVRFSGGLESAGWRLLGGSWSFPRRGRPTPAGRQAWDGAVATLARSLAEHGGPFLVGDTPTIADAALAPFVARFDLAAQRCLDLDVRAASPALAAYLAALEGTPAWGRTFPNRDAFGEAIARFGSLDYFDYHSASLAKPLPDE